MLITLCPRSLGLFMMPAVGVEWWKNIVKAWKNNCQRNKLVQQFNNSTFRNQYNRSSASIGSVSKITNLLVYLK